MRPLKMLYGEAMNPPIPPLMSDKDLRPFIGEKIAAGVTRTTHRHAGREDVVIKVHKRLPARANHTEWLLYNQIHRLPVLRTQFARVWALSDSGLYLIMERLAPLDDRALPAFPAFLRDRKRENFGLTEDGQVKCLDYGDIDLTVVLTLAPLV